MDEQTLKSIEFMAQQMYPGEYVFIIEEVDHGFHATFAFHTPEDQLAFYLRYA